MKKLLNIIPSVLIILILAPSLPYKFSQAEETQHIFSTVGDWIWVYISSGLWDFFSEMGGYIIGSAELIAVVLLIVGFKVARWRFYWAWLTAAILAWAIFFHLFTPLGINVNGDGGTLFTMAVVWFLSGLWLVYNNYTSCNIK